jgi:hypothetical protein
MDPNNSFRNYYNSTCNECISNTGPFITSRSYLTDLPLNNKIISGSEERNAINRTNNYVPYKIVKHVPKKIVNKIINKTINKTCRFNNVALIINPQIKQ